MKRKLAEAPRQHVMMEDDGHHVIWVDLTCKFDCRDLVVVQPPSRTQRRLQCGMNGRGSDAQS